MSDPSASKSTLPNGKPRTDRDRGVAVAGGGDDAEIVFAAQAAYDAVVEADALDTQQQQDGGACRICLQAANDARPLLRFLPVAHAAATMRVAPGVVTFSQDIALHVFCGKTASILPEVMQPNLEILTKAGIKNKHGTGAVQNAAIAKTRCAMIQSRDDQKEKPKQYYLVREFEAHLAVATLEHAKVEPHEPHFARSRHQQQRQHKVVPQKAIAGKRTRKRGRPKSATETATARPGGTEPVDDDKIQCGCGGSHAAVDTPLGIQKWRNHVMTKRHTKWMEDELS